MTKTTKQNNDTFGSQFIKKQRQSGNSFKVIAVNGLFNNNASIDNFAKNLSKYIGHPEFLINFTAFGEWLSAAMLNIFLCILLSRKYAITGFTAFITAFGATILFLTFATAEYIVGPDLKKMVLDTLSTMGPRDILFVVCHSHGGCAARSMLKSMDVKLADRRLVIVTMGSPVSILNCSNHLYPLCFQYKARHDRIARLLTYDKFEIVDQDHPCHAPFAPHSIEYYLNALAADLSSP